MANWFLLSVFGALMTALITINILGPLVRAELKVDLHAEKGVKLTWTMGLQAAGLMASIMWTWIAIERFLRGPGSEFFCWSACRNTTIALRWFFTVAIIALSVAIFSKYYAAVWSLEAGKTDTFSNLNSYHTFFSRPVFVLGATAAALWAISSDNSLLGKVPLAWIFFLTLLGGAAFYD